MNIIKFLLLTNFWSNYFRLNILIQPFLPIIETSFGRKNIAIIKAL